MFPDVINFVLIIAHLETTVLEGYRTFPYRNLMERLESKGNVDHTNVQYIWKWRTIRNEEDR